MNTKRPLHRTSERTSSDQEREHPGIDSLQGTIPFYTSLIYGGFRDSSQEIQMGSGYASMIGSIISAKRAGHWGIRPLGDGEHLLGGDTAAPCRAIRVTDPEHLEGILAEMSGRFVLLWSPVVEDAGDSVILGSEASRPQVVAVLDP